MKERVNPKQFALDIIARLPDTATLEDLRDDFTVILSLLESYRDEERGDMIPHAQVRAEMLEWISKARGRNQPTTT